ncbi:hypothetical protein RB653_009173 [Dictyostelium firmibasis]|uniref:Gamma-butyrobetaine hydroxylase-like N-terminal domain-containing protein n=1 Tax=Dictyostelium firmibasis TaxID=79012 RepID=A0AAN7U1I0_9MYCE
MIINSIKRGFLNNSYNKNKLYFNNSIVSYFGRVYTTNTYNQNNTNKNVFPTEIKLSEKGKRLEITFENKNDNEKNDDIIKYSFSSELLRIETPSVEKSKKGLSMITGRRDVGIIRIERVGNYAIRLVFDDLHDTGIYSWQYLFQLGQTKYSRMKQYLKDLKQYGKSRDPKIHNKQLKQQQQQQPQK